MAVALPLLPSLRAQGQSTASAKRLVTMYTPNGQITNAWGPSSGGVTDFVLNEIHEPLEAHRSRLTLVKGLDLKTAAGGPGGPHQRGIGTLYTGGELQMGEFVDGCGSRAGWANGISIDQLVANTTDTPFKSLELGVRATENDVQGRIAYAGPGQPLPPMLEPLDVYKRIFKDLVVPSDPNAPPVDPMIAERRSVLDTVHKQMTALEAKVSSEDKQKLESHAELIRGIERRLSAMAVECAKPAEPMKLDPSSELDMPMIAELEIDLLTVAFACDLSRVASFEISTGLNRIRYPWLNSLGEGHPLSHMGPSDVDARAQLVARARWHAGLVARLYDRLAQVPEEDGTAADNTLLVWCSEVSEGNTHSHVNMPFIVVGGGWHFQTGRYLDAAGGSHTVLLVSLLNAMGFGVTTFGLPEHCKGPLAVLA
jgi:hypothetical protein